MIGFLDLSSIYSLSQQESFILRGKFYFIILRYLVILWLASYHIANKNGKVKIFNLNNVSQNKNNFGFLYPLGKLHGLLYLL